MHPGCLSTPKNGTINRCESRYYSEAATMYCSSFPSGIQNVVIPNVLFANFTL